MSGTKTTITAATALAVGLGMGMVAKPGNETGLKYADVVDTMTVEDVPAVVEDGKIVVPVQRERSMYRSDSTLVLDSGNTVAAYVTVNDEIVGICKYQIVEKPTAEQVLKIYNRLMVHTEGKPAKETKEIGEIEP